MTHFTSSILDDVFKTPSSSKKSRRRSWFDSPDHVKEQPLEFAEQQVSPSSEMLLGNDGIEEERLILTHFTRAPKLDFGTVRVGKSNVHRLRIHNPHEYDQKVHVDKFPFNAGFSIELTEFLVEAGRDVVLNLTWTPNDGGSVRETVMLRVDGVFRLQAVLLGMAEEPPKKKRKTRAIRSLQPFNIFKPSQSKSLQAVVKPMKRVNTDTCVKDKNKTTCKVLSDVHDENDLNINGRDHTNIASQEPVSPFCRYLNPTFSTQQKQAALRPPSPCTSPTMMRRSTFNKHSPSMPNTPTIDDKAGPRWRTQHDKQVNKKLFPRNTDEDSKENAPPSELRFTNDWEASNISTPVRNKMRRSDTYTKLGNTPTGSVNVHKTVSPKSTVMAFSPKHSDIIENVNEDLHEPVSSNSSASDLFEDSLMSMSVYEKNKKSYFPALSNSVITTTTTDSEDYCVTTECDVSETHNYDVSVDVSVCGGSSVTVEVAQTSPRHKRSSRKSRRSQGLSLNNSQTNGAQEQSTFPGTQVHVRHSPVRPKYLPVIDSETVTKSHSPCNQFDYQHNENGRTHKELFVSPHKENDKSRHCAETSLLDLSTLSDSPHINRSRRRSGHVRTKTYSKDDELNSSHINNDDFRDQSLTELVDAVAERRQKMHFNVGGDVNIEQRSYQFDTTPSLMENITVNAKEVMEEVQSAVTEVVTTVECVDSMECVESIECVESEVFTEEYVENVDHVSRREELDAHCVGEDMMFTDYTRTEYTSTVETNYSDKEVVKSIVDSRVEDVPDFFISSVDDHMDNVMTNSKGQIAMFIGDDRKPVNKKMFLSKPILKKGKVEQLPHSDSGAHHGNPKGRFGRPAGPIGGLTGRRKSSSTTKPAVQKQPLRFVQNSQNKNPLTRTMELRRQAAVNLKNKPVAPPTKKPSVTSTKKPKTKTAIKRIPPKLTFMKPAKTALPKHPLAFAAKNMYYDERWLEKQERGFVKWLNFILTPPDEYCEASKPSKVDAGSISLQDSSCTLKAHRAPTKETLSYRSYAARRRMNRLRRAACKLFQSETFVQLYHKLEVQIETGRIAIRKDRKLHADLGLKQQILDLLLTYNPLWLRMGLETVYGELLMISTNADVVGISHFILTRLLNNPDISAQFVHPTVPHLYKPGYDVALAKFTLKKFLLLVLFLDAAKKDRLIDYDPCLFCVQSDIKTSREILLRFSRDFLSGEGDLTKHMAYLGYSVSHTQMPIDEYDFAVTNLAVDLRDGMKLARVTELLTKSWCLSATLRVPAISRLQKIHNVNAAFTELAKRGLDVTSARGGKLNARDIVDGVRERTLQVLWNLIYNFQVQLLLSDAQLQEEVDFLKKQLKQKSQIALLDAAIESDTLGIPLCKRRESADAADLYFKSKTLSLLLKWTRAVCAFYDLQIENFTVSFSDGRALCYLVHHYHPGLLPLADIHTETTLTYKGLDVSSSSLGSDADDSFTSGYWQSEVNPATGKNSVYEELKANEKQNYKVLYEAVWQLGGVPMMLKMDDMTGQIPDEKVVVTYVSYLCARLMDIRLETRAARCIQTAWRMYKLKGQMAHKQRAHSAAVVIQRAVRRYLYQCECEIKQAASVTLQAWWKGILAKCFVKKMIHQLYVKKITRAATVIQRCVRLFLHQKRVQRQYLMQSLRVEAATCIQAWWRCERQRIKYIIICTAAGIIQEQFRATQACKIQRHKYTVQRSAAIKIQTFYRQYRQRHQHQTQNDAATKIQTAYRSFVARKAYRLKRRSAELVKSYLLACIYRNEFLELKSVALQLQSIYRGNKTRKEIATQHDAARKIQATYRQYMKRLRYLQTYTRCVIMVQRRYKAKLLQRAQLKSYLLRSGAAITIQSYYKGYKCRQEQTRQHSAVLTIQNIYRSYVRRRAVTERVQSAICIQSYYRKYVCERSYRRLVKAAVTIQCWYRGQTQRRAYTTVRDSAIVLQSAFRWWQINNRLSSVLLIQSYARMYICRKRYLQKLQAVCVLQVNIRAMIECKRQRKLYADLRQACITIQSAYRSMKVQWQLSEQHRAATKIQASYKSYKLQSEYQLMRQKTIMLQQYMRKYLHKKKVHREYVQRETAASKIQRIFRYYKQRKMNNAIVIIQSHVRGYLCKKRYVALRQACICVQNVYRGLVQTKLDYEKFHYQRECVMKIQAAYRAQRERTLFKERRLAAITIQSWYKSLQARYQYQCLLKATYVIQQKWRNILLTRETQASYMEQRHSVVTLQKHIRKYLQRKKVHREYVQRETAASKIKQAFRHYKQRKMNNAAVIIQSHMRGYLCKKRYVALRQACICVQNVYRGLVQTRLDYERFHYQRECVVKIQAAYRAYRERTLFKVRRFAAITIQSWYKSLQARYQYQCLLKATYVIQQKWRNILLTRETQASYMEQRHSVVTLQKHIRKYLQRKKVHREYVQRETAASKIQQAFRHYKQRKMNNAAVIIQSHMRGYLCKKRYVALRQACICVQNVYRGLVQTRLDYERFHHQRECVVKIQAAYRAYKERTLFKERRLAAITIQSWYKSLQARYQYQCLLKATYVIQQKWRNILLTRETQTSFMEQRHLVVTLQKHIRKYLQRKKVHREYVQRETAASKIQQAFRHYQLRKMNNAAVIIQSHVRGYLCKKRYVALRQACICVQNVYRGLVQTRLDCERFHYQRVCVVKIQAAYRAYRERTQLKQTQFAAITIQSWYRSLQIKYRYQCLLKATCMIQQQWRNILLTRQAQALYMKQMHAVLTLQKHVRKYLLRKKVHREYVQTQTAAYKIQQIFRDYKQRKMNNAAVMIQSHVRGYLCKKRYVALRQACICVQNVYRGLVQTRLDYERFHHQKQCVVKIQEAYRAHRERTLLKQRHFAAIRIQSWYKSYQARREYRCLLKATYVIQQKWRYLLLTRETQALYMEQRRSVIVLQKQFRKYLCRKKHNDAATLVQKCVRSYLARRKYVCIQKSVVLIQRWYRSIEHARCDHVSFLIQKGAAITIQAWWRGFLCRRVITKLHSAAIVVQTNYRRHRLEKDYNYLRQMILTIQRYYRNYRESQQCRQSYLSQCRAILVIQSAVRAYLAYKQYKARHEAVVLLQSHVRGLECRRVYNLQQSSAVVIQRAYRSHLVQVEQRHTEAAVIIQSTVKSVQARRQYCMMRSAVLVLQSHWRAHQACRRERSNYMNIITAVITIQTAVRRHQIANRYKSMRHGFVRLQALTRGRRSRSMHSKQLASTRSIQEWWRGITLTRQLRASFIAKQQASITLQRYAKIYLMRKYERQQTEIQQSATVIIQKYYRGWVSRKYMKNTSLLVRCAVTHVAVLCIQRSYRKHLMLRRAQEQIKSVVVIQRWMTSRVQRMRYLRIHHSIVMVQRALRVYLKRRLNAACVIQQNVRLWLVKHRDQKKQRAAATVQALWKGYKVRQKLKNKKLTAIRKRIQEANRQATDEKRLCNRTATAIDFLLRCTQLAYILEALMNLDVATRLSSVCCEQLVAGDAVGVIYQLMGSCNRSVPHKELIKYSVNILLNLTKYNITRPAVYLVDNSVDLLVELLAVHRENVAIFTKICTLIGLLAQHERTRQEIVANTKIISKLQSIHNLTSRKHKISTEQAAVKARLAASRSLFGAPLTTPAAQSRNQANSIAPDWVLRRSSINEITHPLRAINFVMNSLHIDPK